MKTIQAIIKSEVGREANPVLQRFVLEDCADVCMNIEERNEFEKFEQTIQSCPAPGIKDTPPGETVECYLQWQYLDNVHGFDEWADIMFSPEVSIENVLDGYDNKRVILKLVSKEGEGKKEEVPLNNHFYLQTEYGPVHVNMNPDADKETFDAVKKMIELAFNKK